MCIAAIRHIGSLQADDAKQRSGLAAGGAKAAALTRGLLQLIKLLDMPTYEYVCDKCGHQFEKFQSIASRPLTICPEDLCKQKRWGKGKVKRAISGGAGLIFKGSGFYITDYRSDKYKEAAKKETASATPAAGDGKTASAGEAKPTAPKPEKKSAKQASTDKG